MYTPSETYACFIKALQTYVDREGHGVQNILALEARISEGYMSQIMNRKRRAPFNTQVNLAAAAGYPYVEFLLSGQRFLTSRDKDLDFIDDGDINHIMHTVRPYFRELQKIKEILNSGEESLINALIGTVNGLHATLESQHKKKRTGS